SEHCREIFRTDESVGVRVVVQSRGKAAKFIEECEWQSREARPARCDGRRGLCGGTAQGSRRKAGEVSRKIVVDGRDARHSMFTKIPGRQLMRMDWWTRIALIVIAVALAAIAMRPIIEPVAVHAD